MKNKCSLCRKDINKPKGHTQFDKSLCEVCMVRYEVLKTFPEFRESERFGIEIGDADVRSINYKLLDVICYQHFMRRLTHYKYGFGGPITFSISVLFFGSFLAVPFYSAEIPVFVSLVLGVILLGLIYVIRKLFWWSKFHRWQRSFRTKMSLGHEKGEIKGSIKLDDVT